MKIASVAREAWLNVVSGTSRALTLTVALLFVTLSIQVSDLMLTRQFVAEAEQYQAAGASIQTISAPGRIDGAACSALSQLPSVRASGALRAAKSDLVLDVLPSSPIPLFEVTLGLPAVLRADVSSESGLILSSQTSIALGRSAGEEVTSGNMTVPVGGTYEYPDDGRRTGFAFAALSVTADAGAPFDECWVDSWPQNHAVQTLILTSVLPTTNAPTEEQPALSTLNTTLGAEFVGAAQNDHRLTLWAYPFAALVAFAICFLAATLRRLEFASALHSQVTKPALVCMLLLESLAWVLPVALVAVAVALYLASMAPAEDYLTTVLQGSKIPAVTVAAGVLGGIVSALVSRENQLFRYFKAR